MKVLVLIIISLFMMSGSHEYSPLMRKTDVGFIVNGRQFMRFNNDERNSMIINYDKLRKINLINIRSYEGNNKR